MSLARPLLDAEAAEFLTSGVVLFASSASQSGVPSLAAASGCSVSRDRREVTIFLSRLEGADVLTDLEAGGPLAVVFSVPSSLKTLQLKARSATIRPFTPDDVPTLEHSEREVTRDFERIGFGGAYATQSFDEPRENLVAIVFTPTEAFDQTPGPRAGTPLEAR